MQLTPVRAIAAITTGYRSGRLLSRSEARTPPEFGMAAC